MIFFAIVTTVVVLLIAPPSTSSNYFAAYGDLVFVDNLVINIKTQSIVSTISGVNLTKAFCHDSKVLLFSSASGKATVYDIKTKQISSSDITADMVDFCCSSDDGYIYYIHNEEHMLKKLKIDGTLVKQVKVTLTGFEI